MAKPPPPEKGFALLARGRVVLATFVAAQIVYVIMLSVTLPRLEAMAGGLIPFDMLPGGYDFAAAQNLLDALGEEGRAFYLTRQIPLDLIYPALFALAYGLAWRWLAPRAWPTLLRFSWFPIAAGLTDYAENVFIIRMLTLYPELPRGLVTAANAATLAKSVLTTITLTALMIMLAIMLLRFARNRLTAKLKS